VRARRSMRSRCHGASRESSAACASFARASGANSDGPGAAGWLRAACGTASERRSVSARARVRSRRCGVSGGLSEAEGGRTAQAEPNFSEFYACFREAPRPETRLDLTVREPRNPVAVHPLKFPGSPADTPPVFGWLWMCSRRSIPPGTSGGFSFGGTSAWRSAVMVAGRCRRVMRRQNKGVSGSRYSVRTIYKAPFHESSGLRSLKWLVAR
jgi:hypothetical protein